MSLTDWDEDTPADYGWADGMPYSLACGCWSEWPDHRCQIGGWRRPADCRCGAPDDCYCHESCDGDPDTTCERHMAEHRQMIEDDHAEALIWNEAHGFWKG